MNRRKFLGNLGLGGVGLATSAALLSSIEVEGAAEFPDHTTYPGMLKVIMDSEVVTLRFPEFGTYTDRKTAQGKDLRVYYGPNYKGDSIVWVMCLEYHYVCLNITNPKAIQEEGLTIRLIEDLLY